ncbi:MAG: RNA methyltransferase [Candidatus Bathyarchaeia archaeon]
MPASLVSELQHLREKTRVIGMVARASAIFRVEDIYVYPDQPDEAHLIRLILNYMETPQYLRRHLFKKRPELRYVGMLPPLRTPHHPLEDKASMLRVGEIREGIVQDVDGESSLVYVGVEKPVRVTGRAPSRGGRATIRITETRPEPRGVFIGRGEVREYWGYEVHISKRGLGELAKEGGFDLTIATSKNGDPYPEISGGLRDRWVMSKSALVAFGSPRQGIEEILSREGRRVEEAFRFNVNTMPRQGCETIRTEEAIYATLAILNLLDYERA